MPETNRKKKQKISSSQMNCCENKNCNFNKKPNRIYQCFTGYRDQLGEGFSRSLQICGFM